MKPRLGTYSKAVLRVFCSYKIIIYKCAKLAIYTRIFENIELTT